MQRTERVGECRSAEGAKPLKRAEGAERAEGATAVERAKEAASALRALRTERAERGERADTADFNQKKYRFATTKRKSHSPKAIYDSQIKNLTAYGPLTDGPRR